MDSIMVWLNESPVSVWLLIAALMVLLWLWSKFDVEITRYAMRHWHTMPSGAKVVISMFKPNIEKLMYLFWIEIYDEMLERVQSTQTKADDKALEELKQQIEAMIQRIDSK